MYLGIALVTLKKHVNFIDFSDSSLKNESKYSRIEHVKFKEAFKKIEGIRSASTNKVSEHAFVILINKKNCRIFPCKKSFGVNTKDPEDLFRT